MPAKRKWVGSIEKPCSTCGVVKPRSEFAKDSRNQCGLKSACRNCYSDYYQKNKEHHQTICKKWAKKNRSKLREADRRWRMRHPDRAKQKSANYAKRFPERFAQWRAQRKSAQINATPKWANQFFIEEIYDLSARRTALKTGGVAKWHVDHIVPLQSKLVCGLHVEHNLRVIPAVVNRRKHNSAWPDMP